MKIAITGGTGFIGRRLIKSLSLFDHSINALSRRIISADISNSNVIWLQGELSDRTALEKLVSGCSVVVNCAGETTNSDNFTSINYECAKLLYDVCKEEGIEKFVQLSSTGVYGRKSDGIINESSDLLPVNLYEESKTNADRWLLKQSGPKVSILRPTNVYGTDMPNNSLRQLVAALERGIFFFIGGRDAVTSYIHVDNVVSAIVTVVESNKNINSNEAYNISDDILLDEFISIVSSAIGISCPRLRVPKMPLVLFLLLVEKVVPFKLPLTLSRVHYLTKTSTYSVGKFMNTFSWEHPSNHKNAISECVKLWCNNSAEDIK